jgi:dienelactone hydrolase
MAQTQTTLRARARRAAAVAEPSGPERQPEAVPTPTRFTWRPVTIVFIVSAVLAALLLMRLSSQERGGPAHTFASVNNVPATLYLPQRVHNGEFPIAPPPGQPRPPLVVVAHGFTADQQIMSNISRSLANHGFAVLAIDFRGHGSNTHPFEGDIVEDLKAAVDWADTSPYIDTNRIAVLGHSMGASAALEFASRDPRVKAVVPVSGGDVIDDARVPSKILFLAAQRDPSFIRDRQKDLAEQLKGKTDIRQVTVGGKDHATILWSDTAIRETQQWLDAAFGTTGPTGRMDGRMGTVGLYLLFALVLLFGAGLAVGRLAPAVARAEVPASAGGQGLLLVAGALVVALPVIALGSPAGFVPAIVGDAQLGYLGAAGALLFVGRALARRAEWSGPIARRLTAGDSWWPAEWRGTLLAGLAGFVAVYVLLQPLSTVFHRLIPTPERFLVWIVGTLLLLPIYLAAESLIRRGTWGGAVGWGLASRVMSIVVAVIGVRIGFLPGVLSLVLPILFGFYLIIELFAAGVYRRNANVAAIAVAEAATVAWLIAVANPIT